MSRERRAKTRFGHLLRLSLMVAPIGACSLDEVRPEDVVRQAGDALLSRNDAAFYDLVDLRGLERQFIDHLRSKNPDNRDPFQAVLAATFASPPDTSINGQATARALALQLLDVEVTVQGMGRARISGKTAFVPVFVTFEGAVDAYPVSVQLEKPESRWRIVAIRHLSDPVRNVRRKVAQTRGEIFLRNEGDREAATSMKVALRNLVTVQEAYFADHATYAPGAAQLGSMYQPPSGLTVRISSASQKGWAASVSSQYLPGATCWIFVGAPLTLPSLPAGSTSKLEEGAPYCATT